MGYFIHLSAADFTIAPENLDAAYVAMCELDRGTLIKSRCRRYDECNTSRSYALLPEDYGVRLGDAKEIFEALGFGVSVDGSGLHIVSYDGNSGQENLFLIAVAPYVKKGGYLCFGDGDDEEWGSCESIEYTYIDGRCQCEKPVYFFPKTEGDEPTAEDIAIKENLESLRLDY